MKMVRSNIIRQIIIKGLVFVTLIAITFAGFFLLPSDQNSYLAAIIDKHALLESTPGARIIIVGGSNVAFGLDSGHLASLLNKPVINDGLYDGLGLQFMLNDLTHFIHSGDMVILIPSYRHWYDGFIEGDSLTFALLLNVFPQAVKSIEVSQYFGILEFYIPILRSKILCPMCFTRNETPIYKRSAFNRYGDVTSHLGKPSNQNITSTTYIRKKASLDPNAIILVNRFAKLARAKGAMVYLVYPASRNSNCISTGDLFDTLDDYLREHLDIPILSHPIDSCIDDEFFFDTAYHLNTAGREMQTSELATILINQGVIKVDPENFSSSK